MKNSFEKKMMRSRIFTMNKSPFISTILLSLRMVETDKVPTAGTDGLTYYYNKEWMGKLTEDEMVFVHAHECLHVAFEHMLRLGSRNRDKFNAAADYAINTILKDMGFTMPDGMLYAAEFAGLSAEQIYVQLPDDAGQGQGGIGQDIIYADGGTPADGEGNGKAQEVSAEQIGEKIRQVVAQAAMNSRMAEEYGSLPGALREMLDDILQPKLDWKQVLRNFLTERMAEGYAWHRPNRRYVDHYLPTRHSEGLKEIVIGVDTSASVTLDVIREFFGEIEGIRSQAKPELITVIYCDARVQKVREFSRHEELEPELIGRGGTDFRPVFDYIRDNGLRPAVVLYFTDMYGTFPEAFDIPTLWLNYGGSNSERWTPPFGQVVDVIPN